MGRTGGRKDPPEAGGRVGKLTYQDLRNQALGEVGKSRNAEDSAMSRLMKRSSARHAVPR